jgi:sigma-B regulation protein RsbU (phosphoserine phosphatase)
MSAEAHALPSPPPLALIVEDDGFERLRLAALLERRGYHVTAAVDGAEALAVLMRRKFDVLITDWQLPAVSGLDVCRSLRHMDPAERPFAMLVTARDGVEDLVEGLEAGADEFMTKPYRAEELTARLHAGRRLLRMRKELVQRTRMLELALRHQGEARDYLDADLAAATRLQYRFLERSVAPGEGLAAAHFFRPAGQIGGDLFGVAMLTPERAGFFHIDATGHGIAAALHAFALTASLNGFRGGATEFDDPAAWVAALNDRSIGDAGEMSCSLVIGWLDLHTNHGRFCQAGHPHPLAVAADGRVRRLGSGGMPVGALEGAIFRNTDFTLAQRERLVLFSDGVTDCVDPTGQAFGADRLQRILGASATQPLDEAVRATGRALDDWRQTATYDDDLSLLVLETES